MSLLQDYKSMPPVSFGTLVETANSVLRQAERDEVSERTVRYYIYQGLMPPARGAPRYGRYVYMHLFGLLATRALQDEGMKLDDIREELTAKSGARLAKLEARVDSWLQREAAPRELVNPIRLVAERRIALTPSVELVVRGELSDRAAIDEALRALQKFQLVAESPSPYGE